MFRGDTGIGEVPPRERGWGRRGGSDLLLPLTHCLWQTQLEKIARKGPNEYCHKQNYSMVTFSDLILIQIFCQAACRWPVAPPEFVIQQCNFSLFLGHPEWWWICEKVVLCLDEIRCSFLRFPCMSLLASVATQNLLAQPRLLLSAPFPPLLTLQKVNFYFLPIFQFNQKSNSKIKKNFLVTMIQVHT